MTIFVAYPLHFLELFLPGIELSPNGGRLLVARLELEKGKANFASSIRKVRRVLSTHLHRVVQKLVLELLDSEDLLEEVVELLLVEHLVAHHGRRWTLTRPAGLLLWREKVTNYWGSCLSVGKLALVPLYLHFSYHGAAIVILLDSTIMRKRPFASSFQSDESQ